MILNKKKVFIITFIFLVILSGYGWLQFNKSTILTQDIKEGIVLNKKNIHLIENKNDFETLKKYIEKPLIVSGNVQQISFDKSYGLIIINENNILISCKFQKDQNHILKNYKLNDLIHVKGIYKGSLDYLVLSNCIVNTK